MTQKIYLTFIILYVFALYSCDNLIGKKNNPKEVVEEKWSEVDTNQVDKPPLFATCLNESEELDNCFQQTVISHIKTHLINNSISVKETFNDTVWVPLLITKNRKIIVEDFVVPEIITSQIPDFLLILEESIKTLPRVEPAIVQSTPVNSRYKLPIVIHMN